MTVTDSKAIAPALAAIVGDPNVWEWATVTDPWRQRIQAAVAPGQAIAALVFPNTPEELAAVVAFTHTHHLPILPCGQGSKLSWGGLVHADVDSPLVVISTARLNRLIDHAVGDLTVTLEAGARFADVQATLAAAGQFLAIDPTIPAEATIGGILATADTGSLRQRYASVRDMVLGLSFVRADGQMAKAGGRVVKNVAGYDLMKLFTGSYGTLGMVTQVTLRVYPLPEASQTLVFTGDGAAIAPLRAAIARSALTPTHFDLISPALVQALNLGTGMGLLLRFQTSAASVEAQQAIATPLGNACGLVPQEVSGGAELDLWQRLRERMTPRPGSGAIAGKIGIEPSQAVVFCQINQFSLPDWYAQIHVASGLGRIFVQEATAAAIAPVREFCQSQRGFLSILEAPPALKQATDVWGDIGNALPVMRQIKQQFDPTHRLSPHRFVGGI